MKNEKERVAHELIIDEDLLNQLEAAHERGVHELIQMDLDLSRIYERLFDMPDGRVKQAVTGDELYYKRLKITLARAREDLADLVKFIDQ